MTSVNVTLQKNSVEVTEASKTTTVESKKTSVVQAVTAGPQGAKGDAGSGFALDSSAKVDKSVIYYDSAAETFKADATWTTKTLVFGGDF